MDTHYRNDCLSKSFSAYVGCHPVTPVLMPVFKIHSPQTRHFLYNFLSVNGLCLWYIVNIHRKYPVLYLKICAKVTTCSRLNMNARVEGLVLYMAWEYPCVFSIASDMIYASQLWDWFRHQRSASQRWSHQLDTHSLTDSLTDL